MRSKSSSVALIPDRFALYRYPVFRLISDDSSNGIRVDIYADPRGDSSGVRLVDSKYCNLDVKDGGIRWNKIRSLYIKNVCFWQTGLSKLAVFGKYGVVVYWGEAHRLSTWVSAVLAKLLGKRVVFWTHGLYGKEGYLKRSLRIWFYRLADTLLLYGEHGKRNLELAGFSPERMFVINNSLNVDHQIAVVDGIKSEDIHKLRCKFCSKSERLLVFVGRLEAQKRLDLLLHAVSILRRRGVKLKVLLIGDGSRRKELGDLSQDLGVSDNLIFYGECYRDEIVLPLVAMSDLCVSPGEVGLTAMHALVCGTPVITHDDMAYQMPEVEAIKPGRSGAFFQRGNVEDLADTISKCLSEVASGQIDRRSCREIIEDYYTPEYQNSVFYKAIEPLLTPSN